MEFIELILINKLDGVILKYPHHDNVDGTVCITGHHLILSSRKEGVRELWVCKNIVKKYYVFFFIFRNYSCSVIYLHYDSDNNNCSKYLSLCTLNSIKY